MEQKEIVWNKQKTDWKDQAILILAIIAIAYISIKAIRLFLLFIMLQGYYEGCMANFNHHNFDGISITERMEMKERWRASCSYYTEKQWREAYQGESENELQYPQD